MLPFNYIKVSRHCHPPGNYTAIGDTCNCHWESQKLCLKQEFKYKREINFFDNLLYFCFFFNPIYVSLQLRVQNAVSAQPCVGKLRISLVLLNFLHCNFRLWLETT